MRRLALGLVLLAAIASTAEAQGPCEPRITCERGPFGTKTYGGTAWDLYGCSDNRSIAIVTARVRSSIGSKQHAEPDTGARSIPLEAFDFDHQPAKGRCAENTPPPSPLLAG